MQNVDMAGTEKRENLVVFTTLAADRRGTMEDIKIAEHACMKYSGRVGRSAAAKSFEPDAVFLAVRAHVRHAYTDYDELLFKYDDRHSARERVRGRIEAVLEGWRA